MSINAGMRCFAPKKVRLNNINYHLVATAYTINQVPGPAGNGWALESDEGGQRLYIVWMSGSPAPTAVTELLAYTCKRVCKSNMCECILHGLK